MSFVNSFTKDKMLLIGEDLIQIKESPFGKGLFATNKIAAGTFICLVTGTESSFDNTIKYKNKESHFLQIGIDRYLLCEPPFLYSNHSCNPNCAISEDFYFYTLTEIERGEELLWDYSTSMLERHWTMQCKCGSPRCRKIIEDFDLLPDALKKKYIDQNIVFPFILNELKEKVVIHR